MMQLVLGGMLAFITAYYTIPIIIRVANAKKLYDEPDSVRKLHVKPIPSLGGLAIFIGFMLCLLLTVNFSIVPEFQYYIASFLILFFVGIKDDIYIISARKKFIVQFLVAAILIFKGGLVISNMQGFLGFSHLDTAFSYVFTLFTIVVITNSFNLIDGVDGLAGSLSLISCTVFGTFFLINGNVSYSILAFGLAASILAFLIYNFHPAKIFMGDTGSLLLGLVNSILVIKFIETAGYYKAHPISAAPAIGFCTLLVPLMDTLKVFGIRIIRGRSPFSPDRNHLHHVLMARGMNHRTITLACSVLSIVFTAFGFFFQQIGTTSLILISISFFIIVISILFFSKGSMKLRVVKSETVNPLSVEKERSISFTSLLNPVQEAVGEDR